MARQAFAPKANLVLTCFYGFLATIAGCFFDTAVVATNLYNFPKDKGVVLGLLKAFLGISAGIYTVAFDAFYKTSDPNSLKPLGFIRLLSFSVSAMCLFAAAFVNKVPLPQQCERKDQKWRRFRVFYATLAVLALGLTAASLVGSLVVELSTLANGLILAGVAAALIQLALLPAWSGGYFADFDAGKSDLSQPLLADVENEEAEGEAGEAEEAGEGEGSGGDLPAKTTREALRTVEFWCLCFSQAAGIGCGLAVLNNFAQLTQALSCTYAPGAADLACKYGDLGAQDPATAFVKLFSIFNCLGRMISGYVSQRYLAEQGVARPLFLFIASALTAGVCFVSAFASVDTLFIVVVLGGLAFGCHWCLTPTILSELFGMGSFATIYQTMSCFPAVSSILMVSLLSGKLYDRNSQPVQVGGVARDVCLGLECFRLTYLVCCGVALAACASSYTVFARSQKLYRRIQLHLKEE